MFESIHVFKYGVFKKEEIDSLKARIRELEEENRKLAVQLEKKDEKTRKTVAVKQEVDEELNEARQKIFSLENEIQKLRKETTSGLSFRFSGSLSRRELDEVIFLLGSLQSKTSTLITIYLARDETLKNITDNIVSRIDTSSIALVDKIESSTGKVIFYDTNQIIKLVIIPLLPVSQSQCFLERQFELEPLKRSLEFDTILALNAHAGETFIGIVEADVFGEHEIVRSSVMGKHKQGGWSQKRFQSLVEEDVKHHADKVRAALAPMIGKHGDIRYVIAGGEGKLVKMILEGYDFPLVIKSMDAVAKGNAEQVLREVMAVRWYGI
ncbi:MAG: Vms1/Ankzf1 family peptidyl-tRNA hydrolase [Candidatus Methanoperedens sp.]|nr:Vms1/Ankzf1 family peptidyl-tRNA hydrolase [Candidatus Methanoperedens sp.]